MSSMKLLAVVLLVCLIVPGVLPQARAQELQPVQRVRSISIPQASLLGAPLLAATG